MYLGIPTLYSKSTKSTLSKQSVFNFRSSIFQKFWNGISKIKNHAEPFVLINCSITNKAIDQSCYTCHCDDKNWKNYSIWLRIEWAVKSIFEISQSVECIFLKSCFIINKAINQPLHNYHCTYWNWKNWVVWLNIEWATRSYFYISRLPAGELLNNHSFFQRF